MTGRLRTLAFTMIGVNSVICSGCERPSESSNAPAPTVQTMDYKRHLRQGVEQMRRHLYTSAAAELQKCQEVKPDDPDLLFHLARLRLAQEADPNVVASLLGRALSQDNEMVKAHRLLYLLYTVTRQPEKAAAHRAAVERLYGALGTVEMEATEYLLGWRQEEPTYTEVRASATAGNAQARYARATTKLTRHGQYDPATAVPTMEALLREYPHLTALRLVYAQTLLNTDVRIQAVDRPELPPISSRLILDYIQSHMEHVVDQSLPGGQVAFRGIDGLARTGLRMGDYDDAVMHLDHLRSQLREGMLKRHYFALGGVARYKQNRHDEAIALLEASVRNDAPSSRTYFPNLWVLHLAYEAAGVPVDQRGLLFPFRRDLPRSGDDAPLRFEDVAARMGVNKFDGLGPSAWGDYDGDGDFDLFVCGCDSYGALYRNDGDHFRDVSVEAGLFHVQSGFSATFQDYDNDGYPDLYIGRDGWNAAASNSLYHNNGDGTFTDVTGVAGVGHPGSSFVHSWLDYDRDGFLDLYVANGILGGGDTNVLYHNNGDGTFTDATAAARLSESRGIKTIGFAIGDYDKDGWPDIFVGGFNVPHRLYHNRGDGTFEQVAIRSGLTSPQSERDRYVSFFFDYDNDTYPDILMTCLAKFRNTLIGMSEYHTSAPDSVREELFAKAPKLYRNNRDGTFTDVSREAGFLYPCGTMGANVADVDNDGFQDVYFATGDPLIARMEPDRFYRNNGDGSFTDWTFATGLGNLGKGHGVTFVDIDGDGDLDMYVPEGGFVHGDAWENAFYLNLQATGNNWLHIDLEGDVSNRDAVGTSVTMTAGGMTQLRQVKGGRGFGSTDSPTIEFGLAKAGIVERLEIRWPSGTRQVFENVPVNQRIFVREGQPWKPRSHGSDEAKAPSATQE
jgi:tetratricopeptide (TPR) repeat protein